LAVVVVIVTIHTTYHHMKGAEIHTHTHTHTQTHTHA